MASNLAAAPASLDVGTLFFIAICVTVLLGLFLLYAWAQERTALAAASIVRGGQRVTATVSVGVSSGAPTTAVDALITRADDALYRAKANGRNRIETADAPVAAAPEPVADAPAYAAERRGRRKEKGVVNNDAPESCIA